MQQATEKVQGESLKGVFVEDNVVDIFVRLASESD